MSRMQRAKGSSLTKGRVGLCPSTPMEPLRFWSKVDFDGSVHPTLNTACWEWTAALDEKGYGLYWFAWIITHGDPGKLEVCHRCDNRKCLRPTHLFLGTHRENMQDAQRKGRLAAGDRSGPRLHPERFEHNRGSGNHWAVLNDDKVREIRRRFAAGGVTKRALGTEFGVSAMMIGDIIRRKYWKHVA